MIRRLLLATTVAALPFGALAQSSDITAPVSRIMKVTEARWAAADGDAPDYFDNLDTDFSTEFAAAYREATKFPAYDGGDSPFDYDVITSSQDGCPLKDLKLSPEGNTTVAVSFKLWTCAPDAESQARVTEIRFNVVTENGKPVIADISRQSEGKWDSLLAEMRETVRLGKEQQ